MRKIKIEHDGRTGEPCLRNLQFCSQSRMLSGVMGREGECPSPFKYDLHDDQEIVMTTHDDLEIEPVENQLDPCVSRDGELIAEVVLDFRGELSLLLTDVWSKPTATAWFPHPHLPRAMRFSEDNEQLWIIRPQDEDPSLCFERWRVESLLDDSLTMAEFSFDWVIHQPRRPLKFQIAADASGKYAAIVSSEDECLLFDIESESEPLVLDTLPANPGRGKRKTYTWIDHRFHPKRPLFGSMTQSTCKLWSIYGQAVGYVDYSEHPSITAIAFAHHADTLGIVTSSGDIAQYSLETGRVTTRMNFNIGSCTSLAFAPDGLTAAVGTTTGEIIIWDIEH